MSPSDSEDLTEVVEWRRDEVALLLSPPTAEHHPAYREVAVFPLSASSPGSR